MAEYDRSTLNSSIDYLLLPFYVPSVSVYRDNAHTATSTIDIVLPAVGGVAAKLSAGGSLFISAGFAGHRGTINRSAGCRCPPETPAVEHRVALVRLRRADVPVRRLPDPYLHDRV